MAISDMGIMLEPMSIDEPVEVAMDMPEVAVAMDMDEVVIPPIPAMSSILARKSRANYSAVKKRED